MAYALDTNIIIHLLRQAPAVITRRDTAVDKGMLLVIPPYVNFELLRGFQYVPAPIKEKLYKQICNHCNMGEQNKSESFTGLCFSWRLIFFSRSKV